jgi:hypothetical protein
MPVGTRVSTSIPRAYLYDARLNSIKDPLAREAHFRAKLHADNLGRMPGDADTLRGLLFPMNPPSVKKMKWVLNAWVNHGLVLRYRVGRCWFVEIGDNGSTMKLVGHMTDRSDFPVPPEKTVRAWERRFGVKRIEVSRYEPSTNPVHTELAPGFTSQSQSQSQKGREGKGAESEGSVRETTADLDRLPPKRKAFDSVTELFARVTGNRFDPEKGFNGYGLRGTFTGIVIEQAREHGVPSTAKLQADFMGMVVDACEDTRGIKAPSGWIKVLSDLRRELGTGK